MPLKDRMRIESTGLVCLDGPQEGEEGSTYERHQACEFRCLRGGSIVRTRGRGWFWGTEDNPASNTLVRKMPGLLVKTFDGFFFSLIF